MRFCILLLVLLLLDSCGEQGSQFAHSGPDLIDAKTPFPVNDTVVNKMICGHHWYFLKQGDEYSMDLTLYVDDNPESVESILIFNHGGDCNSQLNTFSKFSLQHDSLFIYTYTEWRNTEDIRYEWSSWHVEKHIYVFRKSGQCISVSFLQSWDDKSALWKEVTDITGTELPEKLVID